MWDLRMDQLLYVLPPILTQQINVNICIGIRNITQKNSRSKRSWSVTNTY